MSVDERAGCAEQTVVMSTAIAVVLYYPEAEYLQRIVAYAKFCPSIVVVDNTDFVNRDRLFGGIDAVIYAPQGMNKGIAAALNVAARLAIKNGNTWLVMLDQDSDLSHQTYEALVKYIAEAEEANVAIISPIQAPEHCIDRAGSVRSGVFDVTHAMTSGCALRLKAYSDCGVFDEKLFIDHVDSEYCLRLLRGGYRVVKTTDVFLKHSLGDIVSQKFLGIRFRFVSHKPFRSYYFVRNGCYVATKFFWFHPQFALVFIIQVFKLFIKAICFESEKSSRLKMMALGILHFLSGKFGRLAQL